MWERDRNVNFSNWINGNLRESWILSTTSILLPGASDCPAFISLLYVLFLHCVFSSPPVSLLYPHLYTVCFPSFSRSRPISSPWALSFPSPLLPPPLPEIFNHHFVAVVSEPPCAHITVPAAERKTHYLIHFGNDFTVHQDKRAWGYKQGQKYFEIR